MDAVVVRGGSLGNGRKGIGKQTEEVKQGFSEAPVCLEDQRSDRMGVIFSPFVEFGQCAGVAGGHGGLRGTRQSSCSGGGGDHEVKVYGALGSPECDV